MHDHNHPTRGLRRGPRIARFQTALAFFVATMAGLHALSDHYGWRQGHWGPNHSSGYGFFGASDAACDKAQPGAPKSPT
jgi:hypothetical protein